MSFGKKNIVILGILSVLNGCGFAVTKKNQSETESADKETIKTLRENGLQLEAYDASLWGFILSAKSVAVPAQSASASSNAQDNPFAIPPTEGNVGSVGAEPKSNSDAVDTSASAQPKIGLLQETGAPGPIKGMVDDSLIEEDTATVFDAPNSKYGYIAVRKCLRLQTEIEDGLTANGIYCLQVPPLENLSCETPRSLVRGDRLRKSLNNITNENLDLGNLLTSKLGFTYDSINRQWSKKADGITILLNPLRIAALSLESPCDDSTDVPGSDGGQPGPDDSSVKGLVQARLDLSSRLAYQMKIAVDSASRTYIASASAGTSPEYSMRIGRFNPDANPDNSFGNGGYVELKQLEKNSAGYVVRLDEQRNRIYVSGYQGNEQKQVIVALDMSGSLDKTWGGSGVVSMSNATSMSFEVDSEGRVIYFAYEGFKRLTENGSVDKSFGEKGVRAVDLQMTFPSSFTLRGDSFYLLTEQPDRNTLNLISGKFSESTSKVTKIVGQKGDDMQSNQIASSSSQIVAYGRKINTINGDMQDNDGYWVAAFDLEGNLIKEFGDDGIVRSSTGSNQNDVVFDTPSTFWMSGWNGAIRRFDKKGQVVSTIQSNYLYLGADAMALAPDGHLVGAYVAHGGGELFRASPEYLNNFE